MRLLNGVKPDCSGNPALCLGKYPLGIGDASYGGRRDAGDPTARIPLATVWGAANRRGAPPDVGGVSDAEALPSRGRRALLCSACPAVGSVS